MAAASRVTIGSRAPPYVAQTVSWRVIASGVAMTCCSLACSMLLACLGDDVRAVPSYLSYCIHTYDTSTVTESASSYGSKVNTEAVRCTGLMRRQDECCCSQHMHLAERDLLCPVAHTATRRFEAVKF